MTEDLHLPTATGSSNRSFGLVFAGFFCLVAVWPWLGGGAVRLWGFGVASVFAVLALVCPARLALPNRLWTRFGLLLGRIVSPVALAIVFYVAVMPTGLLMRLFGKDPLKLRYDHTAKSYWVRREPRARPDDSMKNQF